MKRTLVLVVSLMLLSLSNVCAQAVLKMDTTICNFGQFTEDTPQTYVFGFTNVGDEPLVIHQAMSSCGCTVPKFTKDPIAPGGRGELRVTYNGKGKYPGHFKKAVTLRSNAKNSLVRVYVEGDMLEKKK